MSLERFAEQPSPEVCSTSRVSSEPRYGNGSLGLPSVHKVTWIVVRGESCVIHGVDLMCL
jgi:hypothetical protein